ncbi:MAG TPA: protein-L-isoaspartate O-methyltransferase [Marmoricola sp.]|jgi:protein-L-isoaspartate(D-aspartate) O-methyltransferase|nr:protein-L-isoaspartate O-methyltransferase [Marmoricola sp.]
MDVVRAAFDAVRREEFLPPRARHRAADDSPVLIGHGQTNSQPRTVDAMLRLLDVQPGHRVLDVGAGSGWTTALLAHLVGAHGSVHGVELVPQLAEWGAGNLARTGVAHADLVRAREGVLGDPDRSPYDRILVSAEADEIPGQLLDQLGDPGRIVLPVNGVMTCVERRGGHDHVTVHGHYRFVPLVTGPGDWHGG